MAEAKRDPPHTARGFRAADQRRPERAPAAAWQYQRICWEIELFGDRQRPRWRALRRKTEAGSGDVAPTGRPHAA